MDGTKPTTALFDVYLRLRPSTAEKERFLDVEQSEHGAPTHITIKPPANDYRKRAVERFAFTRVFQENADQLELFETTGAVPMIEGVLGAAGREGRDGLLATLGVTGSGKSHTILGSKTQRGLTQLTLDLLFKHAQQYLVDAEASNVIFDSICMADAAESQVSTASEFLDGIYSSSDGRTSRAATPALDCSFLSVMPSKRFVPRISELPTYPLINDIQVDVDQDAEYAIVISMYEVYNDRIFDLLTASATGKTTQKRRALLFKSTEASPDRKVVAGLRKVVCSNLEDALLVLETGLHERRVAGTGSNAVSSRSHGFFCVDVKKRHRGHGVPGPWTSSTMTIVDLAGSERARTAKTAGATLAEAGKINESLMYLGQCMQMQSDNAQISTTNPHLVPFRQCKLTELLFSNSLTTSSTNHHHKQPQKSIMIVTADPLGDFNATSQILRYSALAREVTVPRTPSVTSTILASGTAATSTAQTKSASAILEDLEVALAQIASLHESLEIAQLQLQEETNRRIEAEASWTAAEAREAEREAEVREEVCAEMEARFEVEMRRWRVAREVEAEAGEARVDRKVEILVKGLEDGENKENLVETPGKGGRMAELEEENKVLRERLALVEREKGLRSPSKKMRVLKSRRWEGSGMGLDED